MPHTMRSPRYRLHTAEWLGVLALMLALGDCVVHAHYTDALVPFADFLFKPKVQALMHGALALSGTLSLLLYQQSRRTSLRQVHLKESALRASEARLRSFFEATPDALLISDEHGTITMVNRQVEPLLGYAMEELVGMSSEELVPIHLRGNHQKMRERFAVKPSARGMHAGMAFKARRKDGSECDVDVSLSRIETDDGQFFACALRDISERIRAKEQLMASETRLRTIFENEPDCIKLLDSSGMLIDMNAAGLAMIEADTLAQVVGRPMIDFVAPEFQQAFADLHRRVIDGENVQLEFKVIGCRGRARWLETHAAAIQDRGFRAHLAVTRDISERKIAEERIRELAFHDQLTGLPNRTLLHDRLKQAQTISERSGHFCALLFIDIDHFKTLNDTLGHDVGDALLKDVARRLVHCVRAGDTVARLGGDEFMVLLAGLRSGVAEAAADTQDVASKMLTVLNEPYQLGEIAYLCTASIGATLFLAQSVSMEDLIKQADLAMYRAKEAGRNRIRFFDSSMQTVVLLRAAMEKDLRNAMQSNQFSLHYQAQVMDDGQITGAEVLLRWHHPQRGQMPPADFISLSEETGLILPLGHWVLTTACAQLTQWASQPAMAHLTVAVNVSALQFAQVDFVEQVLAVLHSSGANPHRLKLELTESLLIGNVQDTIGKMHALKARGVSFSLDDFGTGYSSLSYLKRLPLDQLKIDRSFVCEVLTDPNDAAIAKTIVALAKSLGLGVIAEGVETLAQRDFLAHAGCHAYQGYLFSRPLPLEDFEEFVRKTLKYPAGNTQRKELESVGLG